jgi:beta-lactamase regulating signal transducer with metallopeptidase domain
MNDAQFFSSLLITHIVQFSLVMLAAGIVVRLTGKRWPHFAFLICMVALVKSLMPPVFSSPAGVFSMHPTLAMSTEVNVATMYDKIRHSGSPIRSSPAQVQPATTLQLAGVSQRPTWGAWFQQLPLMQIFAAIWAAGALFFLGRASMADHKIPAADSRTAQGCTRFRQSDPA